jgi:RNA polymerase sigma factor (sigma-70 family)
MERATSDERLSNISTLWTMLLRAHDTPHDSARSARHALLERYGRAAYRYLFGAVHDPEAAKDLAQDLAVRFLRGDFHRADPGRGRFRDYLKTALIHLVADYRRSQQRLPRSLDRDTPVPAPEEPDDEAVFLAGWRAELLDRTWEALAADHPTEHAALLLRVVQPELTSGAMAEQLNRLIGKPITAAAVRKALERAHDRFADLLVEEVSHSLTEPTITVLEGELQELDLLRYCRSALARRAADSPR